MTTPETATPTAAPTLDADIAAFIAEGHRPEAPTVPADQAEPADDADEGDAEATADDAVEAADDEGEPTETEEKPTGKDSEQLDFAALVAAVDATDLPGFLKALGPAAEKLLTSKAHKALRLQSKELARQTAAAVASEKRATELTEKLAEKYSDPVAVRKAVAEGSKEAVDLFIDHAEKTTGTDWNTIMRWVAKSLAGRPERLQAKAKATDDAKVKDEGERAAAVKQAKDWVSAEVSKVDAELLTHCPELADMVLDEIRVGYHSGIQTPQKALPLALKKLKAQHERLTKALERASKGKKPKASTPAPTPAARAHKAPADPKTAPKSLTEDIAEFMRENNLRR